MQVTGILMEVSLLVLAVMAVISAAQTERKGLTITPKLALINRHYNNNISITCQSSSSLRECQFRVWVEESSSHYREVSIKETDRGQADSNDGNGKYYKLFDYTFNNKGFAGGQCVLRMFYMQTARYFVGCRVRNDTSGWTYAHMAFLVSAFISNNIRYNSSQRPVIKKISVEQNKKSPDIEFKTEKMQSGCEIFYPNQNSNSSESVKLTQSKNFSDNADYSARLEGNTTCIAMLNVTQSSNGILWCLFKKKPDKTVEYTSFDLAIIQALVPPKPPKLTSSIKSSAFGGTLTALCTVKDARPVPRIVWTLGDDVVRNDTDDDQVDRAWSWPWDIKSTTQVLTLNLTERDINKELTCQVFYPNSSVLWWSESFLIVVLATDLTTDLTTDTNDVSFGSNTLTLLIVVVVIFLISLGVVNVIVCLRRKRNVVITAELHQFEETDNEPHYDEINESVLSPGTPTTPPVPGRPRERKYRLTVPRESAPPCPEEPDYIIPDVPDVLDADGYIQPLAKTSIGKGGKSS